MTTDIATQVKNYKGNNSFILKMKDAMTKYGSLTVNQKAAVEKIFKNTAEAKAVEMTDDMKKIAAYEGTNSFVNELKGKLEHMVSCLTNKSQWHFLKFKKKKTKSLLFT